MGTGDHDGGASPYPVNRGRGRESVPVPGQIGDGPGTGDSERPRRPPAGKSPEDGGPVPVPVPAQIGDGDGGVRALLFEARPPGPPLAVRDIPTLLPRMLRPR
jgi:hypothetical protein